MSERLFAGPLKVSSQDGFNAFHKGVFFTASCFSVHGFVASRRQGETIPVAAFFEVGAGRALLAVMAVLNAFFVAL